MDETTDHLIVDILNVANRIRVMQAILDPIIGEEIRQFSQFLISNKDQFRSCLQCVNDHHLDAEMYVFSIRQSQHVLSRILEGDFVEDSEFTYKTDFYTSCLSECIRYREYVILDWFIENNIFKKYNLCSIFSKSFYNSADENSMKIHFAEDFVRCKVIEHTDTDVLFNRYNGQITDFKMAHHSIFLHNLLDKIFRKRTKEINFKFEFPHVRVCIEVLKLYNLPYDLSCLILMQIGYPKRFIDYCSVILKKIEDKRLTLLLHPFKKQRI